MLFFDRKSKVYTRRALRDERHVDVADRAEHARRNSRCAAQTFTNHTNNRASLFNSHGSELFQFGNDRRQCARIIQRQRHTNLGSRNYINDRAMLVKHFEQRPQKTVSAEHTRGTDLNRRNSRLVRDRFDCPRRRFRLGTDERAGLVWGARVTNAHGDGILDSWLNRFRMQHFRAEIRELGRFSIRQALDRLGLRHDARIRSQNSSNIRPDLYLTHAKRGADQRRGVV